MLDAASPSPDRTCLIGLGLSNVVDVSQSRLAYQHSLILFGRIVAVDQRHKPNPLRRMFIEVAISTLELWPLVHLAVDESGSN